MDTIKHSFYPDPPFHCLFRWESGPGRGTMGGQEIGGESRGPATGICIAGVKSCRPKYHPEARGRPLYFCFLLLQTRRRPVSIVMCTAIQIGLSHGTLPTPPPPPLIFPGRPPGAVATVYPRAPAPREPLGRHQNKTRTDEKGSPAVASHPSTQTPRDESSSRNAKTRHPNWGEGPSVEAELRRENGFLAMGNLHPDSGS